MTSQTARAAAPPSPVLQRELLGPIAVLTLNRPEARNSLSEALIAELHAQNFGVALQGDGKIVTCGYRAGSPQTFTYARYNAALNGDAEFIGRAPLPFAFGAPSAAKTKASFSFSDLKSDEKYSFTLVCLSF